MAEGGVPNYLNQDWEYGNLKCLVHHSTERMLLY